MVAAHVTAFLGGGFADLLPHPEQSRARFSLLVLALVPAHLAVRNLGGTVQSLVPATDAVDLGSSTDAVADRVAAWLLSAPLPPRRAGALALAQGGDVQQHTRHALQCDIATAIFSTFWQMCSRAIQHARYALVGGSKGCGTTAINLPFFCLG